MLGKAHFAITVAQWFELGGSSMNRYRVAALSFVSLWLGSTSIALASAPNCFSLPDQRGDHAGSSARKVTLGSRITTTAACEYALAPDATWVALGASDGDFAGLVDALATQTTTTLRERPTTIYGRALKKGARASDAAGSALESVFLAGCTEYLLTEAHGFSLRVPIETQRPTVTRQAGATSCGADHVGLFVVAMASSATAPLLKRGPFVASLATDASELVLDPGAYAIYAARSSDDVGYLLGRVESGSSLTPLRDALRAVEEGRGSAWLRGSWKQGRFHLAPVSAALRNSEAWSELRTAAVANSAWLQRRDKQRNNTTELGKVSLSPEGDAIHLPTNELTRAMVEQYGPEGRTMAPDLSEWSNVLDGIELCVASRYALPAAGARVTANVAPQCMAMSRLMVPLSVQSSGLGSGRVCVRDNLRVMTTTGSRAGRDLPEICTDLQGPTSATAGTQSLLLVTRGSKLRFEGDGVGTLFACTNNVCQPLPDAHGTLSLDQAGLVEVRHADTVDNARSAQALTRARITVIDPEQQWHPVGLHTASHPLDGRPATNNAGNAAPTASTPRRAPRGPWTELRYDSETVFTYTRRQQRLDFRITMARNASAAWNHRGEASSQLTQNIPVFGGIEGTLEGARPAALVALITETPACPEAPGAELSAQVPIDPEQLPPGADFYVQLAQYSGATLPLRCLARAHLRVVESRSLRAVDSIRVGLLGDAQLQVFVTRPAAIGLSLPIVYGFWRWGYGFGLDASISLSSAITFDPSQVTRTGLMASTALVWGPEQLAPRLLSFGVALHAATGTHKDSPFGSVYGAINLSSLIDMAGGR